MNSLSPLTTVHCNLKTQQRNIMSVKMHVICKAKPKISLCPYCKSDRIFLFKLTYRAPSFLGSRQALKCSRNLLFHTTQRFPAAFTATCLRSLHRISKIQSKPTRHFLHSIYCYPPIDYFPTPQVASFLSKGKGVP